MSVLLHALLMAKDQLILIVDDDPNLREIVRFALEKDGYATVQASDGKQALEAFKAKRPALIVLDVMMPELDGAGTLAALRAAETTRDIPVVFLTAKAMPAEVERLKALGAVDVLTKPFEPRELAAQLRTAVAGR